MSAKCMSVKYGKYCTSVAARGDYSKFQALRVSPRPAALVFGTQQCSPVIPGMGSKKGARKD